MDFFREHKKKIFLVLSVVLIIVASLTFGRERAGFLGNIAGFVSRPFQKAGSKITSLFRGKEEASSSSAQIAALEEEIAALKEENRLLEQYKKDNERLTALLDLAQKFQNYATVSCRIIGKETGIYFYSFVLDKGADAGLAAGMPLLSTDGLCGKIIECSKNYSKAISMLDPRFSVSVENLRSGDLGVLKGDYDLMGKGLLRMEYIDYTSDILPGDEIATSNLSDNFPAGVSIGYVSEIIEDETTMTKTAIVVPYGDFKHLDSLLVITDLEK